MGGTENQTDNLQTKAGLPSDGDKETSEKTPITYTQEQVDAAKSDALAAAGRDAKTLTDREAAVKVREDAATAHQAEIDEANRRKDAAELAEARGDPVKLNAYQARKREEKDAADRKAERDTITTERAELDRDKADHQAELDGNKQTNREILIFDIAQAKGVDANGKPIVDAMRLKTLADNLKIESKEQLEALAKELATGKSKDGKDFDPDNALTKGGGKDLSSLTPHELVTQGFSKLNKEK